MCIWPAAAYAAASVGTGPPRCIPELPSAVKESSSPLV
jgi:hypothetical protein